MKQFVLQKIVSKISPKGFVGFAPGAKRYVGVNVLPVLVC